MAVIALAVGTVYGASEFVAEQVADALKQAGHEVHWIESDSASAISEQEEMPLLVITSTTGSGDLPDNILPLFLDLKNQAPYLPQLHYGVIALGDSSYGETFCGGGRQFDELLAELGARRVGTRLQIDATETMEPEQAALAWLPHWLEQLTSVLATAEE